MKHNGIPDSHFLRGIFRLTLTGDFTIPRVNFPNCKLLIKNLRIKCMCVVVLFCLSMEKVI